MNGQPPFSARQGLIATPTIKYRDDLPAKLREPIFQICRHYLPAAFIWERVQAILNPYGIDQMPRGASIAVTKEEDNPDTVAAKQALMHCEWFRLYDVVEDLYAQLVFHETELAHEHEEPRAYPLRNAINKYFRHAGIGWQLCGDGQFVTRDDDAFENTVQTAVSSLAESGRQTAASHLQEAIKALSARPEPNCFGAIYHAMGSLECLARDLAGTPKDTLGEILKRRSDLVPKPLDTALAQIWGYASNEARHVVEGRNPERTEAALIVGLVGAIINYLSAKAG
ncbi:MAG: AbiJ-NTD4 domain-containing protein [Acidobacteriota bacterium]